MKHDLYQKILGVEKSPDKPFNHYILLDIKLFESDGQLIHKAGLKQMKKLREWQLHPDANIRSEVQEMLNQVSMACTVLEVAQKKEIYDNELAKALNIELAQEKTYNVLTGQTELMTCPNCQAKVSTLAILCIECGYNFQTKKRLKTTIEKVGKSKPLAETMLAFKYGLKRRLSWFNNVTTVFTKLFAWLIRTVKLLLVAVFVVGVAYLAIIFMGRSGIKHNYTFRGEFPHSSKVKQMINKSRLWQKVFKKHSRHNEPGVHFEMEWGRDCQNRINYLDITVYLTRRKRVVYHVKMSYGNYPQLIRRMKQHLNNAARAAWKAY